MQNCAQDRTRFGLVADRQRLAVAFILLIFVILATTYSVVTPIFEGFDEYWHYAYVEHVASGYGLPRQPPDQYPHLAKQEASQPPLYYLLAAAICREIPDKGLASVSRQNPQFLPVPWGYPDNQNLIVHTDAERFPYRGITLAVHLSRMLSVLLGAGTVYCTYALARLLFPEQPALAVGAMIVNALIPSFLFNSALVSNDSLVTFLASLTLVLLAKVWMRPISRASSILLGLTLGCAALAKLSGLLLWVFAGLSLVGLAWRRRDSRILTRVVIPTFVLAATLSGWWYIRNWLLYRDFTGLNMMLDIAGRRAPGFGLQDVLAELEGVRRSFWALFGGFNVLAPTWLYVAYDLITLVALVGLVIRACWVMRSRQWRDLTVTASLLLWLTLSVVGLVRWTLLTPASQGRLLYPAVSAIAILLVKGWLALVPERRAFRKWVVAGTGVILLAAAVYVPLFVITPAYARPPLLELEDVSHYVSQEANCRFVDGVTLLGYSMDRQEVMPGDLLRVTVCWRSEKKIEADDLVFVQLLVDNDLIAAQKDTYHGLGSFPTSLWPDGAVLCDRYPLRVADTVPGPSPSILSVGLYRRSGDRLQAYTEDGQPLGDNVRFPGPRITFLEGMRTLNYNFGHKIALVDYRLDRTAVTPGENLGISLFWRATGPMLTDYSATVQVLGESSSKIGQSDVGLPTSTWQPGSTVADHRTIVISEGAPVGVYHIKVGLYEPVAIKNLPVYRDRQALLGGGLLDLWTLRVLPKPAQPE